MKDLLELLTILLFLCSMLGWLVIGVGILIWRIRGKCPKGRLCKNAECRWAYWCPKHQRFSDKEKYLLEQLREYHKKRRADGK